MAQKGVRNRKKIEKKKEEKSWKFKKKLIENLFLIFLIIFKRDEKIFSQILQLRYLNLFIFLFFKLNSAPIFSKFGYVVL